VCLDGVRQVDRVGRVFTVGVFTVGVGGVPTDGVGGDDAGTCAGCISIVRIGGHDAGTRAGRVCGVTGHGGGTPTGFIHNGDVGTHHAGTRAGRIIGIVRHAVVLWVRSGIDGAPLRELQPQLTTGGRLEPGAVLRPGRPALHECTPGSQRFPVAGAGLRIALLAPRRNGVHRCTGRSPAPAQQLPGGSSPVRRGPGFGAGSSSGSGSGSGSSDDLCSAGVPLRITDRIVP
jgi:hypothetical protein